MHASIWMGSYMNKTTSITECSNMFYTQPSFIGVYPTRIEHNDPADGATDLMPSGPPLEPS